MLCGRSFNAAELIGPGDAAYYDTFGGQADIAVMMWDDARRIHAYLCNMQRSADSFPAQAHLQPAATSADNHRTIAATHQQSQQQATLPHR